MCHDDLIIDVGMHDGADTAFYLAKGFRVVAVEANPALVAAGEERFAQAIDEGRLRIIGAAIAETSGTVELAVSDDMSIWSSLSSDFIERNEAIGTTYRHIEVSAMPFEDVLAEVGVPHYLKVDIEGLDMLCIRALHHFEPRPAFVSIESAVTSNQAAAQDVFDEIAELSSLGYQSFKYVNQAKHPKVQMPYPPKEGAFVNAQFETRDSGPFGLETPGRWYPATEALLRAQPIRTHHNVIGLGGRWSRTLPARAYGFIRYKMPRKPGWYDLHASLIER